MDLYMRVVATLGFAFGAFDLLGSYSPRADEDLRGMNERYGDRINVMHLRRTQRKDAGREDRQLAFRQDDGHTMFDDLAKPAAPNPGYTCIGRMRGIAEIRGLQLGI